MNEGGGGGGKYGGGVRDRQTDIQRGKQTEPIQTAQVLKSTSKNKRK